MLRLSAALLMLSLVVPVALAADDADVAPAAPARPALPDLAPAAAAIASTAAGAASATGSAIASVASTAAAIVGTIATAIAAATAAVLSILATLASALGLALLSGARFVAAHPKESAVAAGSVTGASLVAWLVKRAWLSVFLPLYSRLAKSEMLDNTVRNSIYELVKTRPGAHPSAIAEELGLGWGTVVYHLARLEESSLITARSAHNRKCYFAVGSDLDNAGRSAVAAMSTDKARAIVDVLRAEPGLSQKQMAERLGMSQALASWHVKRLIASGILVSTRDGRSNLLHVAEHVPVIAAPATGALAA